MSERRELTEDEHRFVIHCLEDQFSFGYIHPGNEAEMFYLLRIGLMGMDGFKYCWPEVARENRRRCLASQGW